MLLNHKFFYVGILSLFIAASDVVADGTGVVDQLILEEQQAYARENAKLLQEVEKPEQVSSQVPVGPDPYVVKPAPPPSYFVGLFGADTHYRVEIYYLGSVMDYGLGDLLPGGLRLTAVNPQYVTVVRDGKSERLYLTSVAAIAGKMTGDRSVMSYPANGLPSGLQ